MYGQQGPAQWAGQQQRQQHNSMQNLINMLMQVKMMKHREDVDKDRFGQEQALQEQRQSSLDRFRQEQVRQWDKPSAPSKPSTYREKVNDLVATGMSIQDAIKEVQQIKAKEPGIPKSIHRNLGAWMAENYGPDWRQEMAYDDFKDIRNHYQELIRADRAKKKTTGEDTKKASWTRNSNYIKGALARLNKERERMVKGLDPGNKKHMAQQQPRIMNIDKGIAELDRINSLLQSGEPLPPEESQKVKNILTNIEQVKSGLYDFATGQSSVVNTINEAGLTKEEKKRVMISPTTGEMFIEKDDGWYLVTKKK